MKTKTEHTPILEERKPPRVTPLAAGLAAVSDYISLGVDLEAYLMAIEGGRTHDEAVTIARFPPLLGAG